LPRQDKRMAVFVAGADETSSDATRGRFFFGGWVAPEEDWYRYFAPAWQERVLNGPPAIDYFHTVDIKSPKWRTRYGLSDSAAEKRIDEAFSVIRSQGSLVPIMATLDVGHFRDTFKNVKIEFETPGGTAAKRPEPDYYCFQRYATCVLMHVYRTHPDAEKVDFIVEVNGQITRHIQHFHEHFPAMLRKHHPELKHLVGELIPGTKNRVPLQAADLLCWYTRRRNSLDARDQRRYFDMAQRRGWMDIVLNDELSLMVHRLEQRAQARTANRDDEDDVAVS
jgi:hypothetical protein